MVGSQIKTGAVLSYVGVAFSAITGLLYTPWMISSIGADDYGLYTLALSIINFFLLDFGLGNAVSRFMSKYYAEGRSDLANEFLGLAYKLYAVAAGVIFFALFVVYIFIDQIYANLTPQQLGTFKVLYIVVASYSVVSFPFVSFNGVLIANERFVALNLCNLLQKVATVLLIVVALLLGAGVYALVVVNAGVGLVFIVVKYLVIKTCTSARPSFSKTKKGMIRDVSEFSFWAMVVQICQRFIFSVMPSVLAILTNTWEIALFGLAASLESYVWSVANALNSMFVPKVSRVLAGDPREGSLQDLAERLGRLQLCIIGAIVVGFAAFGSRFVTCWVGPDYSLLYVCTLLVILPSLIDLPLMIANTAIIAAGEVKARGQVYIVMAAANVVLGFLLSMQFGAVGACLSICLAYLLRTGGMCMLYQQKVGLDLRAFFVRVFSRWSIVAVVSAIIGVAASMLIPFVGWLGFFAVAALFTVVYIVLCWTFYFSVEERSAVSAFVNRSRGR